MVNTGKTPNTGRIRPCSSRRLIENTIGTVSMGGVYGEDCDIAKVLPGEMSAPTGAADWACDPEAAERLWALSERLTRTRFGAWR